MSQVDKNPVPVPGEEAELSEEELDNVSGGQNTINPGTVPSASVGTLKPMSVGTATTRQTEDNSFASLIVKGNGRV